MSMYALHPQPIAGAKARNLPISGTSATLDLENGKWFRLVSTGDCYIRLQKQAAGAAVAATSTDILLPAGSPMILAMNQWDRITSITVSGSGVLSALEVQGGM